MGLMKEVYARYSETVSPTTMRETALQVLMDMNVDLDIFGTPPTKGSLLIISNHPGAHDSHVIRASCDIDNLHVTALVTGERYGDLHGDHEIPIYAKPDLKDRLIYGLSYASFRPSYAMSDTASIQALNRESISKAADLVSREEPVLFFPTGAGGADADNERGWKPGIGFLIKQIDSPSAKIIFANIQNSGRMSFRRLVPRNYRSRVLKPRRISVGYSDPFSVAELSISGEQHGRQVAQFIEEMYHETFQV